MANDKYTERCVGRLLLLGLPLAAFCVATAAEAQATYVGSAACKDCHTSRYNGWREGVHAQFVRPMAAAGKSAPAGNEATRAPFALSKAKYVLGNMHKMVFLQQAGDHLVLLPGEFDVGDRSWNPISVQLWDPQAVSAALPAEGEGSSKLVNWNQRCARCHTTGYDAATGSYSELGVSCESCHGPGSVHLKTQGKERMINPEALNGELGNHICAQCHSYGTDRATGKPFPTAYRPGTDLSETFTFEKPTLGTNTALFFGNGMTRRHHAQYNELAQSKHIQNGVRCFDCHQVHRAKNVAPSENTQLIGLTERVLLKRSAQHVCTTCHLPDSPGFAITRTGAAGPLRDKHTQHPPVILKRGPPIPSQPKGSTEQARMLCSECHMPLVMREEAGYAIRSHQFKPPAPADTIAHGAPNACAECHIEDAAWAVRQLQGWPSQKVKTVPVPRKQR